SLIATPAANTAATAATAAAGDPKPAPGGPSSVPPNKRFHLIESLFVQRGHGSDAVSRELSPQSGQTILGARQVHFVGQHQVPSAQLRELRHLVIHLANGVDGAADTQRGR